MAKYRKRPVEVEAVQWTGENQREMFEFLGGDPEQYMTPVGNNHFINWALGEGGLLIKTPQGDRVAMIGSYVLKDEEERYYVSSSDEFLRDFEKAMELKFTPTTPESYIGKKESHMTDEGYRNAKG